MSLTNKDYIALAKILSGVKAESPRMADPQTAIAAITHRLADYCEQNPKFDRDRFLADCGLRTG